MSTQIAEQPVIKKKSLHMKIKHELDGLSVYLQSDVLEKLFKQ
jgi:hypothetical protein